MVQPRLPPPARTRRQCSGIRAIRTTPNHAALLGSAHVPVLRVRGRRARRHCAVLGPGGRAVPRRGARQRGTQALPAARHRGHDADLCRLHRLHADAGRACTPALPALVRRGIHRAHAWRLLDAGAVSALPGRGPGHETDTPLLGYACSHRTRNRRSAAVRRHADDAGEVRGVHALRGARAGLLVCVRSLGPGLVPGRRRRTHARPLVCDRIRRPRHPLGLRLSRDHLAGVDRHDGRDPVRPDGPDHAVLRARHAAGRAADRVRDPPRAPVRHRPAHPLDDQAVDARRGGRDDHLRALGRREPAAVVRARQPCRPAGGGTRGVLPGPAATIRRACRQHSDAEHAEHAGVRRAPQAAGLRAAVAEALQGGGISEKERALLNRLRDTLGIAKADADALERDLQREAVATA